MKKLLALLLVLLALAACNQPTPTPTPTAVAGQPGPTSTPLPAATETTAPAVPTETPAPEPTTEPTVAATNTSAPQPPTLTPAPTDEPAEPSGVTPTPVVAPNTIPEAAIVIARPGPGSKVASPITVTGVASPTFEQNLVIRILSADGTIIVQQPTTIQSDLGQRGAYEATLDFDIDERMPAFIQVFSDSPMDGAVVTLSSVVVELLPPAEAGEQDIIENEDTLEHIVITSPAPGDLVTGGTLTLEGIGRAGFENTLVAELRDINGALLANLAITLDAPLGEYGEFTVDLPYTVASETPGRVTVRDVSPAHGGDSFLSSVNIRLAP